MCSRRWLSSLPLAVVGHVGRADQAGRSYSDALHETNDLRRCSSCKAILQFVLQQHLAIPHPVSISDSHNSIAKFLPLCSVNEDLYTLVIQMRGPSRATSNDAATDQIKLYQALSSQYEEEEHNRTSDNTKDANDFTIDKTEAPRRSFYIVALAISLHFLFLLYASGFTPQEETWRGSSVWLHDAICYLFADTRCLGL